jgi:hypothetical protein
MGQVSRATPVKEKIGKWSATATGKLKNKEQLILRNRTITP